MRITPRRDWRLVSPPGGRAFVAPGRPAVWKVAIEGVSEEEEEAFGAFVRHVADVDGGELWTREGTNALVAVSVACEPRDLPAKERISVTGPGGYLFERKDGRYEEVRGSEGFSASEINSKQFYLHGHEISSGLRDREVSASHGTSGATDRARFTVTKAAIREVSFLGDNTVLKSDDGAVTFSAPQYKDANLDGDANDEGDRSFPICYVRSSSNVIVSAKFIMTPKPDGTVLVKATGGGDFPLNLEPTAVSGAGTEISLSPTQMSGKLDDKIACLKGMPINWFVSVDDGANWIGMGHSTNDLYVTWCKPCASENIQTYFEVGCSAASGVTGLVGVDDDAVLDKIWGKFRSKGISRVSDGKVLTYYGFDDVNGNGVWDEGIDIDKNDPGKCTVVSARELVRMRNGQCHSWADFLCQVLNAQGLNQVNGYANRIVAVKAGDGYVMFAIKNWERIGPCNEWYIVASNAGVDGMLNLPEIKTGEARDQIGVSGQGNSPNPPSMFGNHFICRIGTRLYDPSYGIGPFNSFDAYEKDALDGAIIVIKQSTYIALYGKLKWYLVLSIINAKSPAELRQGMERLKNITLRQKAFLFLLCSDADPKYLSGTLPWNGGSIEGFDVKKRSARCLLLLSHVLGEKTVPITHEMNASQEGAVLNRFRKQCIEMLNNAEERHVEERMRFLTTNLPRLSRAEKMKAVEDEEIYAFPLLIHDPDVEIRKAVARCSNTPFSLLLQMRKDPDPLVAQLANRNFITARGMETVIEKTWFGRIVMKFALSDTVREARDVWQQITNLSESRQYKVCLWLASQLDDLRYSPALGGPPPEGAHDLSLVGGKSAWLLEHLLGKMLIPVTGNTPKDVLERQKRRVVSLVQARFSPEKSSK